MRYVVVAAIIAALLAVLIIGTAFFIFIFVTMFSAASGPTNF